MTDDIMKKLEGRLQDLTSEEATLEKQRIDCALTLYTLAACIVAEYDWQVLYANKHEDDKDAVEKMSLLAIAKARAIAESYVVNMKHLSNLTARQRRCQVSHEGAIAAWKELYELLLSANVRPPIGPIENPLTFELIHKAAMDAYRNGVAKPTTNNTQP